MRKLSDILNNAPLFEHYVGEKGMDSNRRVMNNLELAKSMEAENKDELEIKQRTGWERGLDNNWKYEIESGDIIENSLDSIRKLPDLWKSEILYDIYPKLREVRVVFGNTAGECTSDTLRFSITDLYWLNDNIPQNQKSAYKKVFVGTLIHEIQHLIQHQEGWSSGAPTLDMGYIKNEISHFKEYLKFLKDNKDATVETARNQAKDKSLSVQQRLYWKDLYNELVYDNTVEAVIKDTEINIARFEEEASAENSYYSNLGEQEAYAVQRRNFDNNKKDKLLKYYKTTREGTKYSK